MFVWLLTACASLPGDLEKPPSYAVPPPAVAGRDDVSRFMLLNQGTDAFLARAVLAERATRTIDAQYYILYDDPVANTFLALLIDAADRGVRVRLLLDDFLAKKKDPRLAALDAHPNAEVRLFNPFGVGAPKYLQAVMRMNTITRRMHNKAFITDNTALIVGGRNIADEYFDGSMRISYNDLDVLTWGPVVPQMSRAFDAYWNHELAYPLSAFTGQATDGDEARAVRTGLLVDARAGATSLYTEALLSSAFAENLRTRTGNVYEGETRLIADDPDKLTASRARTDLFLWDAVVEEFAAAREEALIITPYFVPTERGAADLIALEARGVDVIVFTNSGATNNHATVHAKYARYRKRLVEAGVTIYELRADASRGNTIAQPEGEDVGKDATLHTKAFVIDRQRTFVGSMNFDPRSVTENTEQGVIFESGHMGRDIAGWFDANALTVAYRLGLDEDGGLTWTTVVDGETVATVKEPDLSFGDRLLNTLLGVLPIEGKV